VAIAQQLNSGREKFHHFAGEMPGHSPNEETEAGGHHEIVETCENHEEFVEARRSIVFRR
jgi:hypothetical protein